MYKLNTLPLATLCHKTLFKLFSGGSTFLWSKSGISIVLSKVKTTQMYLLKQQHISNILDSIVYINI